MLAPHTEEMFMSSVASSTARDRDSWLFHPVTEVVSAIVSFVAYVGLLGWHAGTALFIVVLGHELGHWLVLKRYGIPTRGILFLVVLALTPFSRLKDQTRYQDAMVFLAGPLTGIPISIIYLLLHMRTGDVGFAIGAYTSVAINVFNLIPINGLDGGRVLDVMWPSMNRNRTRFLLFIMMSGVTSLITAMWSVSIGIIMAGVFIYKFRTAPVADTSVDRIPMSDRQLSAVQILYTWGIAVLVLLVLTVDSGGATGKAFTNLALQQLATVWHAIWG